MGDCLLRINAFILVLTAALTAMPASAATYVVKEGDVLGAIAEKQLNASSRWREIYDLNRGVIKDPECLPLGAKLILPDPAAKPASKVTVEEGVYHTVAPGETLSGILTRYHVDKSVFLKFNNLKSLHALQVGQKLYIPSSRDRKRGEFKTAHRGLLGDLGRLARKALLWPLHGTISSGFGPRNGRFHEGVDILKETGSPIHAALDGVVVRSEWYGNYGKVVDVDHGHGFVTRYAHCSRLLVRKGAPVRRGDVIGLVGSTGRATTSHLHFEVLVHNRPVNPHRFEL